MSMFADNPDFYPTPRAIARRMVAKITKQDARYFLEPSAGKGDIADAIRQPITYEEWAAEHPTQADGDRFYRNNFGENVRAHVDVIESYPALTSVLRGKGYDVVGHDWLTYDGVSYYDAILMNPPFSQGDEHLLKAWDFLYHGEIVCLLNAETIRNPHTEKRKRLVQIIEQFGEVEFLGDCFATAERSTGVDVAMVYLKKVAEDDTPDLWAKTTTAEQHHGVEFDGDATMLAIRDNLGNMEHWFNMANEHWMKGIEHIRKAKFFMDQNKVSDLHSSREEGFDKILAMALRNVHTCRSEYLRRHRKLAWTSVFHQMEFNRWLDSRQQERFLRDVERDATIPFTATNIRATLENVFLSRKKLFEESVANVFDALCSHAVENGSGPVVPESLKRSWRKGEGWKTNDSYKVNQKLIFPHGISYGYGGFHLSYGGDAPTIYSDLDRILCVLDGRPFEKCLTVGHAISTKAEQVRSRTNSGGWTFESEYFEGRFYKKGTVHLKWKRLDLWEAFNKTAAAGKKWLGEDTQQYRPKKKSAETSWHCERNGHRYENGVCTACEDPEVDEVAAVECELCRSIFEHTGRIHCPIHEEGIPQLSTDTPKMASLPGFSASL